MKISSKKYLFFLTALLFTLPHCAKEDKNIENMSFDELKQKTLSSIEQKQKDLAIECLEKLVAQHPDNENIAEYKLMLADQYFENGNLPSAYQMYDHFTEFYPSDQKAEYANYRSILSKFYQTLKFDCDQSDTENTIKLCKNYNSNNLNKTYKSDVLDIQHTCERKLIDKEIYVYNFYLKKGNFEAAQNRLDYLKVNFLPENPSLEARLLFLESKLAHKQKNKNLEKEKIDILANKYPESQFTKMAQQLGSKMPFIF